MEHNGWDLTRSPTSDSVVRPFFSKFTFVFLLPNVLYRMVPTQCSMEWMIKFEIPTWKKQDKHGCITLWLGFCRNRRCGELVILIKCYHPIPFLLIAIFAVFSAVFWWLFSLRGPVRLERSLVPFRQFNPFHVPFEEQQMSYHTFFDIDLVTNFTLL